jgi:hypothetical protein
VTQRLHKHCVAGLATPAEAEEAFYANLNTLDTGQWDAQDHATQWLWTYNNDRPNIPFMVCRQTMKGQRGIGGITPAMKLKMAA